MHMSLTFAHSYYEYSSNSDWIKDLKFDIKSLENI